MRVNPLFSLGAKLFYLMTILVAATVAALSWQTGRDMQSFLEKTIQGDLIGESEKTASQVSGLMETWTNHLATSMADSTKFPANELKPRLAAMVAQNKNYLALHTFLVPKGSTKGDDLKLFASAVAPDATSMDQTLTRRIHTQITSRLGVKTGTVVLLPLSSSLKQPALGLAMAFETEKPEEIRWGVLSVHAARLQSILSQGATQRSQLVDRKGLLFASKNGHEVKSRINLHSLPIVKDAIKTEGGSGFRREYRDDENRAWIGAYTKLDRFDDLLVLVERDAATAFGDTRKVVIRSLLYGLLFVLIASAFAFATASGITRGLREVASGTLRLATGDFSTPIIPRTHDEVGHLSLSVNHMAGQILGLMQNQVEKARLDKELETAKIVQSTFFPSKDISSGPLKITGYNQPASECGGDLWGWFPVREGVDFVFVADAMGHGTPAALVTAVAYASYVSVGGLIKSHGLTIDNPEQVLQHMNRTIREAVEDRLTVTAFGMFIDWNKGVIKACGAGHPGPFLLPVSGDDPRLGKKKSKDGSIPPISMQLKGPPLGESSQPVFETSEMPLRAGDRVVLYSDGLIECENIHGKQWGKKNLTRAISGMASQDPGQWKMKIIDEAFQFFDRVPIKDDVTIVVVECDRAWVPAPAETPIPPPAVQAVEPPSESLFSMNLGGDGSESASS